MTLHLDSALSFPQPSLFGDPWEESFEGDASPTFKGPSLEAVLVKEAPSLVKGPLSVVDARHFERFYAKVVDGNYTSHLRDEFHGTSLEGFSLDHKMWKWTDRTNTLNDFVSSRIEGKFNAVMREGDITTRERYLGLVDSLVAANSRAIGKVTNARYRIAQQENVLRDLRGIQNRLVTLKDRVHVVYDFKPLDVKLKTGNMLPYWETGRYEQAVNAEVVSWTTQMRVVGDPVTYAFEKLQEACMAVAHLPDEGMQKARALYNTAFEQHIKDSGLLEAKPKPKPRYVVRSKTVPAAYRPGGFTEGDGFLDDRRYLAPSQMPDYVSPPQDPRYSRGTLRRMDRGLDTGVCTMPGVDRKDLGLPPLPDNNQSRWYSPSVIARDSSSQSVVPYQGLPRVVSRPKGIFSRLFSALLLLVK